MRLAAMIFSFILISVFTGCALNSDTSSLHLLTTNDKGDQAYIDTRTVQIKDDKIIAELRFNLATPGENGMKSSTWKVQLKPAERLLKILSVTGYDASGKKLPAVSVEERPEVTEDNGYSRYTFIAPDSPLIKEYQAIIDYCLAQKLPINTTPPPYITPGYHFAGAYPSTLLFFDPASIKAEGDSLFFTARVIYSENNAQGVRYENGTMEVKLLMKKFRGVSRTTFTATGQQVSQDTGTDGWQTIAPNSIVNALVEQVHEYAHDHGIKIAE